MDSLPLKIVFGALFCALVIRHLLFRKRRCVQCGKKVYVRNEAGRCAECLSTQARGMMAQKRILDHARRQKQPYKDKKK
jgi:hypothetical protein